MMQSAGKIVVSGLTKDYGAGKAVDDLSFTVEPGSITGFLGPNGAGKTTTLLMLLGLIQPDAGYATISGRSYAELARPNDEVGAVLDASSFHPARSGRDHLGIYCTVNGYPSQRADEVLRLVGLEPASRRAVRSYSQGMRQRLALATALLGDPRVLVLDEPSNGLDPEGIAWLRRLLRDLALRGRTVLISSHILSEMQELVDRVVIINKGRLVRQGTLDHLNGWHERVVSVRTRQVDDLAAAVERASRHGARVERTGPDRLRITGMETAEIGQLAFVERIELLELTTERARLEQAFFSLTADPSAEPFSLAEA